MAINVSHNVLLLRLPISGCCSKAELLKWNPFNILLGTNQFSYDVTSQTHLTLINVIIGLIVYLILFYGIAFVIFNKRNV